VQKISILWLLCIAFVAGVAISWHLNSPLISSLILIPAVIFVLIYGWSWRLVILAVLAYGAGCFNASLERDKHQILPQTGSAVFIKGNVHSLGRYNQIRLDSENYGLLEVQLSSKSLKPFEGDYIELKATVDKALSYKESFDRYLLSQGVKAKLKHAYITTIQAPLSLNYRWRSYIATWRSKLMSIHRLTLDTESAIIVQKILLGRASPQSISPELRALASNLGVSHIFAASGLHLTALGLFVAYVLSFFRLGVVWRSLIILVFLSFYCFLGGWSPSLTRAYMMGAFLLLGKCLQRQANLSNILCACIVFHLLLDPDAVGDLGFQFSYLAMMGLLLWNNSFAQRLSILPESVAKLLTVPVSAQILVLPLQMIHFGSLPFYSPLSNLLAVPLGTGILLLGMIGSLLSVMGEIGWLIGSLTGLLNKLLITAFSFWLKFLGRLPGADFRVEEVSALWVCGAYIVILAGLSWWRHSLNKHALLLGILCLYSSKIVAHKDNIQIESFAGQYYEAVLVTDFNKERILFCRGVDREKTWFKLNDRLLKDFSLKELDWLVGNCHIFSRIPVKRQLTSLSKETVILSNHLKLKADQQAYLLLGEGFSALMPFAGQIGKNDKEFYSIVRPLHPHARMKTFLWSQIPQGEYCLLPKLSKQDRVKVRKLIGKSCETVISSRQRLLIDSQGISLEE